MYQRVTIVNLDESNISITKSFAVSGETNKVTEFNVNNYLPIQSLPVEVENKRQKELLPSTLSVILIHS